jgi:hypothetical protein
LLGKGLGRSWLCRSVLLAGFARFSGVLPLFYRRDCVAATSAGKQATNGVHQVHFVFPRFIATRQLRVLALRSPNQIRKLPTLLRKTELTFYPWCAGCRIPVHACLFTGSLSLWRGLSGACRCRESNCENENKDCRKAFHGASPSIGVPARLPSSMVWAARWTSLGAQAVQFELARISSMPFVTCALIGWASAVTLVESARTSSAWDVSVANIFRQ